MVFAATDPTTILLWCGATAVLLFAVAGGFFAGVMAAPLLQDRAIRRASSEVRRMYKLVVEQVERAQRLCGELASATNCALTTEEWQRLDRVQKGFQEAIARIAEASRQEEMPALANAAVEKLRPQSFGVNWSKEPADEATGLPNHAAYDLNLAAMLAQATETRLASGLLLVRMDKADSLRCRLGQNAMEKLLGRLASVVVRSARDEDLLCRIGFDTLALL